MVWVSSAVTRVNILGHMLITSLLLPKAADGFEVTEVSAICVSPFLLYEHLFLFVIILYLVFSIFSSAI